MRLTLNWLKDYVDIDLSPEDLAHLLTMAGLEVEALEPPWAGTGSGGGRAPDLRGKAPECGSAHPVPDRHRRRGGGGGLRGTQCPGRHDHGVCAPPA